MASPKSLLMCDSTKGYGPAEHVMDYFISYTLRLAKDVNCVDTPCLYPYIQYITTKLFEIGMSDFSNIKSISVTKQWKYIDLVVELDLYNGDNTESHVLLIENKHFSKIKNNKQGIPQIEVYKKHFEAKFSDKKLHYVLISSQGHGEVWDLYKDACEKAGFKCYAMDDLLPEIMKVPDEDDYHYIDTEDPIFNQFWLREWPCAIDS